MIKFLKMGVSCQSLTSEDDLTSIERPSWLTYQYFAMKYSDPYLVFEVPVRYAYNKIYFVSEFNDTDNTISEECCEVLTNGLEDFMGKDFAIQDVFLYLLVSDGLGIYDLTNKKRNRENVTYYEPIVWLGTQNITEALKLDPNEELVYILPIFSL